jgi:S-adenosylmethionine-diacylgycerolhomoserine-N-methlytransferase
MNPMTNPHAAKMDAMYRRQRYIYDLSRKYFLLGRDRLLARLPVLRRRLILPFSPIRFP